jgi:hypothetical protein
MTLERRFRRRDEIERQNRADPGPSSYESFQPYTTIES